MAIQRVIHNFHKVFHKLEQLVETGLVCNWMVTEIPWTEVLTPAKVLLW